MALMTLEMLAARSRAKRNKKNIQSKRVENRLSSELVDKLELMLQSNDRVMMEVSPRVVAEFLNILSGRALVMYDFEQVDANKFIFYNKEISI